MGLRIHTMPIQVPLPDSHLEPLQWSLPGPVLELGFHPFNPVFPFCVLQPELRASPQGGMLTLLLVSWSYLFPLLLPLLG